jgi:DNA mismatch repair protein MutS2
MRRELDAAFRDAHAQVAAVIRDLQRGGTARDAAHARERLLALARRAREAEQEARSAAEPAGGEAEPRPPDTGPLPALDWHRARVGDPVQLPGGGGGTLASLPDRRGRVEVLCGSARLTVPVERVRGAAPPAPARAAQAARPKRVSAPASAAESGTGGGSDSCDLRGLRVDEALDQLQAALDRAALRDRAQLRVIHGVGTGALREAVQRFLRDSPYVKRFHGAAPEEGGDGVTIAEF